MSGSVVPPFLLFCSTALWGNLIQFWDPRVSRTTLVVTKPTHAHPPMPADLILETSSQGTWASQCTSNFTPGSPATSLPSEHPSWLGGAADCISKVTATRSPIPHVLTA